MICPILYNILRVLNHLNRITQCSNWLLAHDIFAFLVICLFGYQVIIVLSLSLYSPLYMDVKLIVLSITMIYVWHYFYVISSHTSYLHVYFYILPSGFYSFISIYCLYRIFVCRNNIHFSDIWHFWCVHSGSSCFKIVDNANQTIVVSAVRVIVGSHLRYWSFCWWVSNL